MKLLALRLCEHDSNISYFDGEKLHYYKSERRHQVKHHAINDLHNWKQEIFDVWGVDYNDIDEIAIVIDPWRYNLPLNEEEFFPGIEYKFLDVNKKTKVYRVNHHWAHALSIFPHYKLEDERPEYDFVIDGFGDENNAWTVFKNGVPYKRGYLDKNGSLGQAMGRAGMWLGVKYIHEMDIAGKVMGLQSYGNFDKKFYDEIKQYDMYSVDKLFNIMNFEKYYNDELIAKLKPLDWIRTVHERAGEVLLKFFEEITEKDYNAKISYSGGVAMNVIWNTILKEKFKNLIIPPHCADDGISLGAIEFLRRRNNLEPFKLENFPFIQSDEKPETELSNDTAKQVAKLLADGKVVAVYQNNGEIGPRALGHRSVLMNPTIPFAKQIVNVIKKRENYRPFGASILKEYQKQYFSTDIENPYMLYVGKPTKDNLESITHVDGTCRYQTVDESNKVLHMILTEFCKLTGVPVLLNTSFNVGGKPIIASVEDSLEYFNNSELDNLVVGDTVYKKT